MTQQSVTSFRFEIIPIASLSGPFTQIMRTNKPVSRLPVLTHGGGRADAHQSPLTQLRRLVSSCFLFEDTFYESGMGIAQEIKTLCQQVESSDLRALAVRARTELKLRHVSLWLALWTNDAVAVEEVVRRPDEIGEMISMWQAHKPEGVSRTPTHAVCRGLRRAFRRFSEYDLAKWNRKATVSLRDAMKMLHPTPRNAEQADLWRRLLQDKLTTPDTWEAALSAGANKTQTWTRLLQEHKLGDMAFLQNLRNMVEAGVDENLIRQRLLNWNTKSVALPFRFLTAARAVPRLESEIEIAMTAGLRAATRLTGSTLYIVDVSGSMGQLLSNKATLTRLDAASSLAMVLREISENVTIYATGGNDCTRKHATALVPPRHTFALRDAIDQAKATLGGGGIFAHQALTWISEQEKERKYDRVILLTDEQDCDTAGKRLVDAPLLGKHNYLINVGTNKPGLEVRGSWTRFSGFSERIADWILFEEAY